MIVGLTYDLRSEYLAMGYSMEETAELDKEDTIDQIENALQGCGYRTERIGHFRSLAKKLLDGGKWDIVFNICEGMYGDGREALVPALLDAYKIPYVFSGPATLAVSLNKYLTKRVIRDAGIPTPDFILVESEKDLDKKKPDFPLFAKPVSEGTGKGIDNKSIIETEDDFETVCINLLKKFQQPVLVEEYLPGREFTAGVIGHGNSTRVIGVMEVHFVKGEKSIYSYETKENWIGRVEYEPVKGVMFEECETVAAGVWKAIGAQDAGRVDLKIGSDGRVQFIEVNPLAGINQVNSDLPILAAMNGISYQQLIGTIMENAINRTKIQNG
jgi:D-alanine-D-alanine ligase